MPVEISIKTQCLSDQRERRVGPPGAVYKKKLIKSFWEEFEEHFFQKGFLQGFSFMNNLGQKGFLTSFILCYLSNQQK
jgi:hypothetical protein